MEAESFVHGLEIISGSIMLYYLTSKHLKQQKFDATIFVR